MLDYASFVPQTKQLQHYFAISKAWQQTGSTKRNFIDFLIHTPYTIPVTIVFDYTSRVRNSKKLIMVVPASSLLGFCGLVGSVSEPVITPPLLCVPFIWLGLPGKPPLLELSVLSTALTTFIASTSPAFLIIWTVCSWLAWTTFLLSIYEWENIGLIITLRSKSCRTAQKRCKWLQWSVNNKMTDNSVDMMTYLTSCLSIQQQMDIISADPQNFLWNGGINHFTPYFT